MTKRFLSIPDIVVSGIVSLMANCPPAKGRSLTAPASISFGERVVGYGLHAEWVQTTPLQDEIASGTQPDEQKPSMVDNPGR